MVLMGKLICAQKSTNKLSHRSRNCGLRGVLPVFTSKLGLYISFARSVHGTDKQPATSFISNQSSLVAIMNPTLFPPNSSLFLGDLSKFCSEADLEKLFGQYGEINQIRIMRNTNTGKALSYGFISFINNECAALAMENLNGISLHGRSMR